MATSSREKARAWRSKCDSIYARAIYVDFIGPLLDRGKTLEAVAQQLESARIPKVRGTAPWSPQDVSALLVKVAALAPSACNPKDWLREIQRLTPDLGDALDRHHENG